MIRDKAKRNVNEIELFTPQGGGSMRHTDHSSAQGRNIHQKRVRESDKVK
jgi:hypothetical protein